MEDLRRELEHRPLVLAAVALCVGLTAVLHPANLLFLLPLLVARRPGPVALAFLAGLILAPRPAPLLAATWVRGTATVLSVPFERPEGQFADVALGERRLRVQFPREALVSRGETWRIEGKAAPLSEMSEGLRLKGIEGRLAPVAFVKIADGPWPWRAADAWRRGFAAFVRGSLAPDDARWLLGFSVRVRDFDEEESDSLVDTGTVHLIAASGLHVAILGLAAVGLGSSLGAPRAATLGVATTLVLFYAMATGLHHPTLRAALGFVVGASAYLFRREPDGLSALALAAIVYLPFDPAEVYGLGFQLSTTIVGMLVLWPRRVLEEPVRTARAALVKHARDLAAVALVAALAAEPILAAREGRASLLTVPANVLAVPPAMAAVALALALYPLRAAWALPWAGGLVAFARWIVVGSATLPGAFVFAPFSPYWLLLWYAPWIAFWRPRARPCR